MRESNGWYLLGWVWLLLMCSKNIVVKLPRLALQVEMSWHHSLVVSVGQYVVTQLSELLGCRLNMDVLFVDRSGVSIYLCKGDLWLYWSASWEILLCLFQLFQLIVQHLEWLITTQDVVRVLIFVFFFLVGNMSKPLFYRWLLNPHSWHLFIKPCGIFQTLKWGSWLVELVVCMLSSMLCPKNDLIWFINAQKSSLNWWCRLFFGGCCWIRSTTLSCLLILGLKRCMLCCQLVCGFHKCNFLVSKFVSNVKFVSIIKIAHKHPPAYWNRNSLLREGLDLGLWILSLGWHLVQMVAMLFSPVLIVWQSTLFWLHVL